MNNTELMLEINRLSTIEKLKKENKILNDKIKKIRQIIKNYDNDSMPKDCWYIDTIIDILEQE